MPKITFLIDPSTDNSSGWDVRCFSWTKAKDRQIFHTIKWTGPDDDGNFKGETALLPAGRYGVRGAVIGVGNEIAISTEEEWPVVQPRNNEWPLKIAVDASTGTQNSDTWYFEIGAGDAA
jgi:hypothetical protein